MLKHFVNTAHFYADNHYFFTGLKDLFIHRNTLKNRISLPAYF